MATKIYPKLWYVIAPDRDGLAYMTDWAKTQAFAKKEQTGIQWAGGYHGKHKGQVHPQIVDNVPLTGFKIMSNIGTRYSTSNKLMRVRDPRGFVLEVPIDSMAYLLQHVTVEKGEIKDLCIWGRDGGHTLLPFGSPLAVEALKASSADKGKGIPAKDLEPGQGYKLSNGREYLYIGRAKVMRRETSDGNDIAFTPARVSFFVPANQIKTLFDRNKQWSFETEQTKAWNASFHYKTLGLKLPTKDIKQSTTRYVFPPYKTVHDNSKLDMAVITAKLRAYASPKFAEKTDLNDPKILQTVREHIDQAFLDPRYTVHYGGANDYDDRYVLDSLEWLD